MQPQHSNPENRFGKHGFGVLDSGASTSTGVPAGRLVLSVMATMGVACPPAGALCCGGAGASWGGSGAVLAGPPVADDVEVVADDAWAARAKLTEALSKVAKDS